ncbi:MAG: hypothetical protein HY898_23675 [Deltaproteobacteria bacterium]|nr:hypothetical protein [Deltaproteobacteria bacterium]
MRQLGLAPILLLAAVTLACAAVVRALWGTKRRTLSVAMAATVMALAIPSAVLWLRRAPRAVAPPPSSLGSASVAASAPSAPASAAASAVAKRGPPYLHPKEATLVIAHGLIADAWVNSFSTAGRQLGDEAIRAEVGFPTTGLTAGMRYAVDHYEEDGWGRPFQLSHKGSKVRISSAGEDGAFGTPDDITVEFRGAERRAWTWAERRHAFFVQALVDQTVLFYHREPGKVLHRIRLAQELTGQSLFGVLLDSDFRPGALANLLSRLAEPPGSSLVMAVLPVDDFYYY